jgi:signal transduction histidine kinase
MVETVSMPCVEDPSHDWRSLAYFFGTLLLRSTAERQPEVPRSDDRLVGLVVHELRSPVAIIKAYAQLLEAQVSQQRSTPAGSHEIAAHIREQADLMAEWVDAMLDVQRLCSGQLPLSMTRVDLVQLAWMVAEDFQQTTRRHRIRVLANGPIPLPVRADRLRLRQVLGNVIENAVKYSSGGTIQVRVGVQKGASRAMVAVHDEGPGVAPGDVDRIFAPFEQAERRAVGLGVGLYLSRQIARLHGGELWAESRGRVNGSTFILALPMACDVVATGVNAA